MRNLSIRLSDDTGTIYRWTIRRVPRALNCTTGQPSRIITGWEFEDHDGCVRFVEGGWRELIPRFYATAENYGFTVASRLD